MASFLEKLKGDLTRYGKLTLESAPRLEFGDITLINCLGHAFYIYGAFEFLES